MKNYIRISTLLLAVAVSCSKEPVAEMPLVLTMPQDVTLTANTGTSLTFAWKTVEGAKQYAARLEYSDGTFIQQKNPSEPSVSFDGLKKGTAYAFKVRAVADKVTSD